MKKVFVWLLLLLFLLPVVAMAEQLAEAAAEVVASEIPTNPVTWEQLATIGGAAINSTQVTCMSGGQRLLSH